MWKYSLNVLTQDIYFINGKGRRFNTRFAKEHQRKLHLSPVPDHDDVLSNPHSHASKFSGTISWKSGSFYSSKGGLMQMVLKLNVQQAYISVWVSAYLWKCCASCMLATNKELPNKNGPSFSLYQVCRTSTIWAVIVLRSLWSWAVISFLLRIHSSSTGTRTATHSSAT